MRIAIAAVILVACGGRAAPPPQPIESSAAPSPAPAAPPSDGRLCDVVAGASFDATALEGRYMCQLRIDGDWKTGYPCEVTLDAAGYAYRASDQFSEDFVDLGHVEVQAGEAPWIEATMFCLARDEDECGDLAFGYLGQGTEGWTGELSFRLGPGRATELLLCRQPWPDGVVLP